MVLQKVFERLWADYTALNPSALKIMDLFTRGGDTVVNDHIAFRTLNDKRINLEIISKIFVNHGYQAAGEYLFEDKHLFAKHFEIPGDAASPKIFISELVLQEMSPFIQDTFIRLLDKIPLMATQDELIFSGTLFNPLSYEVYQKMKKESEYAAWFYVFGFRANHFTVSVNHLQKYNSLEKVNQLLVNNGFALNTTGGAIKGSPQDFLRQSSTMADMVIIHFEEGTFEIPCCYYEFAQRYIKPDGRLFTGFVAKSADKIFESTDNVRKR